MVKIAEVTRMTNRAPILVPMWSFEISVLSPLHSPMMSGTATGAVICDAEGWIYTLSAFLFSGAARPTGSLFFSLQAYAYESRQGTPIRKWSEWSVIPWFDWRILTYGPFFETHVASSCIR